MSANADATSRVRRLEAPDFTRWRELWLGYQTFYNITIAEDVTENTWKRLLDDAEPVFGAVILDGDAIAGIVHYIFHRSTWTSGDYCYLQDLYVDAEFRTRGHARRLIEHVYAEARQAAAARVYWLTHRDNDTAIKLYDKLADNAGFIQYRKTI